MSSPAPIDVVREIFRCFIFDEDPFHMLAEDVIWEVPMLDQPLEHFRGHAGVADFFRRWLGAWEDYKIELEAVRQAPDGRILSYFTEHGRGRVSGAPVKMSPVGLWTVTDGRVIHYRGYTDRNEAETEAGLP